MLTISARPQRALQLARFMGLGIPGALEPKRRLKDEPNGHIKT